MLLDTPLYAGLTLDTLLLRLGAAALGGMIIGLDREILGKAAGLRTMMLVSLAAAVFTILTLGLAADPGGTDTRIRADPIRVVEAVVTGVAFLGAGSIIQARGAVRGLTTGAGIWMVGAIGTACGAGLYVLAGLATVMAATIMSGLGLVERRIRRHRPRPTEAGGDVDAPET
ncbi:MAG: MgtC/SapB family protein [Azospirillaceae bacterium]